MLNDATAPFDVRLLFAFHLLAWSREVRDHTWMSYPLLNIFFPLYILI